MAPGTLREALSDAYDQMDAAPAEAAPEPTPTTDTAPAPEPQEAAPETAPARARGDDGRFVKQERAASESPATGTPQAKAGAPPLPAQEKGAAVSPAAAPSPTPAEPKFKAPASWKVGLREKWGGLAPDLQEEINRRESEITKGLQEAADARRFRDAVSEAFRPYEMLARASGQHPVQYATGLMNLAASLQTGTPQQRAGILANLVREYGDVNLLAQALDNPSQPSQPQQPAQHFDPSAAIDAAIERRMQVANDRRAQHEVEEFSKGHEFANDPTVRRRMAALISAEADAGVELTLSDAYDQVVQSHPEYRGVIEQRKAAEAAAKAQADAQRARAANVSPRSTPAAAPPAQPKGLRAVLEAKYDEMDR